jgi:gentisate 1,2-dioxygenase
MGLTDEFYERAAEASCSPLWRRNRSLDLRVAPYVWRWATMEPLIREAGAGEGLESIGERRALSLRNPGFKGQRHGTISTISTAIQLIKPGEIAKAHRHTSAAIRFIIQESTAYTVVNGEKVFMEEGDLVLTPSMMWHDHAHAGLTNRDMIWLDALDSPLMMYLETQLGDQFPEDTQPVTIPDGYTAGRIGRGLMRGFRDKATERTLPLIYKWADSYAALQESRDSSPFDGVAMEYVNPLTAGHTLPTMSCSLQMLRPQEQTRSHRHTHSVVYHVARGEGCTMVNGTRLDWTAHDTFTVPAWAWHEHANASSTNDAVLFSLSDLPVVEAMGVSYEEEGEHEAMTSLVERAETPGSNEARRATDAAAALVMR